MITVKFFNDRSIIKGFEVKGHSGLAQHGSDILCAAVSSACYMTANTLSEVMKLDIKAEVKPDGYMKVMLSDVTEESQNLLKGFQIHMNELEKDYRKNLKVIYGGAENA